MSTLFKGFERIEEARERLSGASFLAGLFDGRPDFELLLTPPEPPKNKRPARPSVDRSKHFCGRRWTRRRSSARRKFPTR